MPRNNKRKSDILNALEDLVDAVYESQCYTDPGVSEALCAAEYQIDVSQGFVDNTEESWLNFREIWFKKVPSSKG